MLRSVLHVVEVTSESHPLIMCSNCERSGSSTVVTVSKYHSRTLETCVPDNDRVPCVGIDGT